MGSCALKIIYMGHLVNQPKILVKISVSNFNIGSGPVENFLQIKCNQWARTPNQFLHRELRGCLDCLWAPDFISFIFCLSNYIIHTFPKSLPWRIENKGKEGHWVTKNQLSFKESSFPQQISISNRTPDRNEKTEISRLRGSR